MLLRGLRQIHSRGSLSSGSGRSGYMKGYAPEGGSGSCFIIVIPGPVS
jgi:hypothetical protein